MTDETSPALSIRQPWAELIISGKKPIEIRSWKTHYRGRIWIHAGQYSDESLDQSHGFKNLFRGGFIGSAELSSIEPFDAYRWESWRSRHLDPGAYHPGLYAWVLVNAHRFEEPIPAPGQKSLFVPGAAVFPQLLHAESLFS
jgi:hypothetical protein